MGIAGAGAIQRVGGSEAMVMMAIFTSCYVWKIIQLENSWFSKKCDWGGFSGTYFMDALGSTDSFHSQIHSGIPIIQQSARVSI